MSTTLYIFAYILLGIAQALRYDRDNVDEEPLEHTLMTGFYGVFPWMGAIAEIAAGLADATLTWWLWPRGERWARFKLAVKAKFKKETTP